MPGLQGKRILLGVTGSIAAYKAAEWVRALVKEEAQVQVMLTEAAERFVPALTFAALAGTPVRRAGRIASRGPSARARRAGAAHVRVS